jgi:hypothetical protein
VTARFPDLWRCNSELKRVERLPSGGIFIVASLLPSVMTGHEVLALSRPVDKLARPSSGKARVYLFHREGSSRQRPDICSPSRSLRVLQRPPAQDQPTLRRPAAAPPAHWRRPTACPGPYRLPASPARSSARTRVISAEPASSNCHHILWRRPLGGTWRGAFSSSTARWLERVYRRPRVGWHRICRNRR